MSDCEQYDLPHHVKKLYQLKRQQRAAAKEYYLNYLYNPHRPINDGMPFDPALQRLSAMTSYHVENFQPKPKHWAGFIVFLLPIGGLAAYIIRSKAKQEELLRSGKSSSFEILETYAPSCKRKWK